MAEPDSDGSVKRPLQRTIPKASKDEHLERLRYDIDAVLQLQLQSYSDEAWEPLAEALLEYGFGVIKGWLYTGEIFTQVALTGFGALPRCPQDWLDDDTIHELTGETVAEALNYFKFQVLMKNRWDATKGASLATYFVGQCKFKFANVYKVWHRDQSDHRGHAADLKLPDVVSKADRPDTKVMADAATQAVLDQLATPLARRVFYRKFVLGDSYQAIADTTPGIKDAKAAENLVYRERRRLQTK